MTRNTSLFCFFCFFALFAIAVKFGKSLLIYDWSIFVFGVAAFVFFICGVASVFLSVFYKYIYRYDPELKNAVNYFIFGFLIWKELHSVDDNE